MRAMQIIEWGKPLEAREYPDPEPKGEEVLLRVEAAGVCHSDVHIWDGHFDLGGGQQISLESRGVRLPFTMGHEIAGEVVALGPDARRWKVGDKVMALVVGGGYAEYCPAHESHCLPVPPNLTMAEASAIPETFFTVWHNVFERGKLKAGETLLVHGGSSGIGTAAIQLAKAFGARVLVTAGSEEKCNACRTLGADLAINYKSEDFVAAVKGATGGQGCELILDMVGGDYIERNYEAAAVEGRVVQIAFQGSPKATVDFRRIMLKRLTHTGSTLRARSVADKGAIARAVETQVLPLIARAQVKAVMDLRFPLRDAAGAHRRMETSQHIGKIVLDVA